MFLLYFFSRKRGSLLTFLAIVFGSTVFTRTTAIRQCELKPFWSWCAVIRYHDRELLKENLLNCLLLVPMGLLLPIIFNHKVRLNQALLAGFLVSASIELSQLIFKRGLFEWDDMIHNALGCVFGCWVMDWIFVKLKNRKWDGDSRLLAVPFYLIVDGAVDEGGCTFAMISR